MRRSLKLGGRLDRYVGSLFMSSYATALFMVVGLFLVLDLAAKIDEYIEPMKDGTATPSVLIVRYYLLHIPFLFLQVAPFVTLVASMFSVAKLLKHQETIAALAAGVSAHRLLLPVLVLACLAGGAMFALREGLSFRLANKRDALRFVLEEKNYDQVYRNLFMRDLSGSVVQLQEFRPSTGEPAFAEIRGLRAVLATNREWVTIEADRAVYVQRGTGTGWRLENGRRSDSLGTRPIEMLDGFEFTPALALTVARAHDSQLDLSYSETRAMTRRDPDNVVYQTLLHYHVTFPLANLVLVLVGVPLLMRNERRRAGAGLAAGSALCICFFASDLVFRNLGLQASLDPRMAAWLPVLLFGSLGIVLFESMRT
ncbi:MAG: LptF/LptG family permease [Planctomycetes bacterium]|nr:LptF/LptG family permease [Planctomycetota bacterium]